MSKQILTARRIDAIKPDPSRRVEIPDGLLPGLYLIVQPSGAKSWALRTRINGSTAKITLGKLAVLSLAKAREKARAAIEKVQAGADPREERRARQRAVSLPGTLNELCDRYVEQHLKRNVRRWKAAEGEINNHIRPHLGALRLGEITRGHVREMLAALEVDYPVAANRALARLRAVFNWGAERDLVATDPTLGIKRPTKERPVSRILSDEELAAVWRATDGLKYPAQQFARFLILTGQRRDDVRLMHWREIDLGRGDWTIAPERYKSDRAHLVPLTDAMIEMLRAMPFRNRGGYVLSPNGGDIPYGNVVRPKHATDKASGVTGWTWHDLRRTLRTGLSRLGIRPDISERVIGHAVGGRLGATYDTHEFRDERLAALEAWGAHVRAIVDGQPSANVVSLRV